MKRLPPALAFLIISGCVSLATVRILAAQQGHPVTGVVVDRSGTGIEGAEVFLDGSRTPIVTGPTGRFRLDDVREGRHWVFARRIGYAPQRCSITIGAAREVIFRLDQIPVELPEIEVMALSGFRHRRLQDFWFRYRSNWGRLATRDDIERRGARDLSSLIRRWLPFAPLTIPQIIRYESDRAPVMGVRHRPSFATQCPPVISINGAPPMLEGSNFVPIAYTSVDEFSIESVEAVEVYRPGLMTIPWEFQHYRRTGSCGLVVIWLK